MASSTTVPITSTNANNVIRLRLKPATIINANVPTNDTTIPTNGIIVERTSCKNTYTTKITRMIASISVRTTLLIDANKKSLVLFTWSNSTPLGRSLRTSSRSWSISSFTAVAFEPAVWKTIAITPG